MIFFLLYPLLLLCCYRGYKLFQNYRTAKRIGLPIIIIPACLDEPLWMLMRPVFAWVQYLPFGLGSWYLYTEIGWPTIDRTHTHSKLGDTFVLVSPSANQIVTAYPPAVQIIYRKYKTWQKPPVMTDIFKAVYGTQLSSTNAEDWQRHRKIIQPAFNDQNIRFVWDESLRQTRDWLLTIESKRGSKADFEGVREDVSILAMHVLTAVGFGTQADFASGVRQLPPGHKLSLIEALNEILKNILLTVLYSGIKKVPTAFLPSALKKLQLAVKEFKMYMQESVLRQVQLTHSSSTASSTTLVAALVRANEEEKQEKQSQSSRPSYLTDDELYGNLFVFNLAGFETTAGTMTFALIYLAANPHFQAWVTEEVDKHFTNRPTTYEETYPKLTRCLALMYETLRLASHAPQMIRAAKEPQLLPTGPDETVEVPPGTYVTAHFYHVHLDPKRWGPDASEFNPKRFVSIDAASGNETLAEPPGGAGYIAWLSGPRTCPGKKFSQVEFVAVMACLLSQYQVEPLAEMNESAAAAKSRLLSVADDFYFNVSTHLKRPKDIAVRFVKRKTQL